MKNFVLLLCFLAAAPLAFAQGSKHMDVYRMAKGMGDINTAIVALHYEMQDNPSDALKDSLASMYFLAGNNFQAITLAEELLEKDENNARMLEMTAIAYSNAGALKEALDRYERLFRQTKEPYHLYQIVVNQYNLKRYGECVGSLNALLGMEGVNEEEIAINVNQRQRQKVKLSAAAWNVLGVLQREQKEMDSAIKSFEKALEIQDDFVLAQGNLEATKKAMAGEDAPSGQTGN